MRLCFSFLEFAFFSKYAKIMLQAHPVAFFYLLYVNVRFPLAFLFIPYPVLLPLYHVSSSFQRHP
jgi:hypothetical protein